MEKPLIKTAEIHAYEPKWWERALSSVMFYTSKTWWDCATRRWAAGLGTLLIRFSARNDAYQRHCDEEFKILGWPGDDDMQELMCQQLRDIAAMFSTQGHSGFSAGYAQAYIKSILAFEPLSPLTGHDLEWVNIGLTEDTKEVIYMNRRCGRVCKIGQNGQAYDGDGWILEEPDGARYTSSNYKRPVEFPYYPKSDTIYVDAEGNRLPPKQVLFRVIYHAPEDNPEIEVLEVKHAYILASTSEAAKEAVLTTVTNKDHLVDVAKISEGDEIINLLRSA